MQSTYIERYKGIKYPLKLRCFWTVQKQLKTAKMTVVNLLGPLQKAQEITFFR
jgi:hypothetical protein